MTLEDALKNVPIKRRAYFRYKFGIKFQESHRTIKSDEEFLSCVKMKSMLSLLRWENTEEYRTLVAIYLQGKYGNDLLEIYNSVSEKAKKGDPKSIEILMKLQTEVKMLAKSKITRSKKSKIEDDNDDNDGLEL